MEKKQYGASTILGDNSQLHIKLVTISDLYGERWIQRHTLWLLVFHALWISTCGGCGRTDQVVAPLEAMNDAARRGRWAEAWQFSGAVREQYVDDCKVLAQLALIAFENQQHEEAADLLMRACRVESFANEDRVQQAVVSALFVGRLFDALDFLAEAVNTQPDQTETRRLIYDLLIGLEERTRAEPHGQYLVKRRLIDVNLLTSLCNTGRNPLEPTSLQKMMARNPDDKRPLIGKALSALEKRLFQDAMMILEEILEAHPESVQAQILLGEAIVGATEFDSISSWENRLRGEFEREPGCWLTRARVASHRQDHAGAAAAYWQATERDPLLIAAWEGLGLELKQLGSSGSAVTSRTLDAIDNRIQQLEQLKLAKERFIRSGNISRVTAIEIGLTLAKLGRLWEAEAWLAVAHTLPEDPAADVVSARETVINRMKGEMPWQLREGHPELQLDLSSYASAANQEK